MEGSIFDLEGMFRKKDAEWLRFKIENFVKNHNGRIKIGDLQKFLENDEIELLKARLELNDADLINEIHLRSDQQTLGDESACPIIKCDGCGVKIRLRAPFEKGIHICPRCKSEFKVFVFADEIFITFLSRKNSQQKSSANEADPYEVLGIDKNSSLDQIKEAYRKKIQACHPDKVSEMDPEIKKVAEKLAHKIIKAYKSIMDTKGLGIR